MQIHGKIYVNGNWVQPHSARSDEIARSIAGEVGMPLKMSQRIQAGLPPLVMSSYAKLLREYQFEETIGNSLVVREPVGVARRMRAGRVDINGGAFNLLASFGGYKQSGHGRELGRYGLEEFLEIKSLQLPQSLQQ